MVKDGIKEILEAKQFPGVHGSRDSFGVGNEFYDSKTNKVIDTWQKWEKAGFRQPDINKSKVGNIIKEKQNKLKGYKSNKQELQQAL